MNKLTHIDEDGAVKMVDVTDKAVTDREAVVGGHIQMQAETVRLIVEGKTAKGNVLGNSTHCRYYGGQAHVGNYSNVSSPLPLRVSI